MSRCGAGSMGRAHRWQLRAQRRTDRRGSATGKSILHRGTEGGPAGRWTRAEDDEHRHGKVGGVGVHGAGHVAADSGTGGIAAKYPGRIGDTPLVGCGFYAEDGLGGVSSTGHGEDFIRLLLARRATEYLAQGLSAWGASRAAITLLSTRIGGSGGPILLDAQGRVGIARTTPAMACAHIVQVVE